MSEAISVHHGDFGRAALYRLDKPIITHAHREGHLIFYVAGGRATVRVGDRQYDANNRFAVAVNPWEPHSFDLVDPTEPCLCLTFYIKPIWFMETGSNAQSGGLSFGSPRIALTAEIEQWISRFNVLLMDDDSPEHFDTYLFEATNLCHEVSWRGAEKRCARAMITGKFTDYRVRRSLKLMRECFAEDIEIDWLAREAGLSRPHFFKLFKKQMGITPNLYLNTLRAEQAIEDLMTTSKSVTEISYDLGFSSQASFTRFFTSNVGIPPSDYRRVANVS